MPKSAREIVEWKLGSLKTKVQHAQQSIDELCERVKSSSMDFNSLNLSLDNVIFSFEDFKSGFDEMCPQLGASTELKKKGNFSQEATPSCFLSKLESTKDANKSDVAARLDKLEEEFSMLRSTIHGSEASSQRGIVPHMSHLENSFNDGRQKLMSFEGRLQDINARHVSFVNDVKNKMKEKDEKIIAIGRFEKLEEIFQTTVSDNDACKRRLTSVEDRLRAVQPVCGADVDEDVTAELSSLRSDVVNIETQVLRRIRQLENRPKVSFIVTIKHEGPWDNVPIERVGSVKLNIGDGFQKDQCRFCAPLDGIYCMVLYVRLVLRGKVGVQLWLNDWLYPTCSVTVKSKHEEGSGVNIVSLKKGDCLRLRVYDGTPFDICTLSGWLVSRGTGIQE